VRGVWYTTTGGSGGRGVLIIVGTLLLLGSGAAAELATAVLAVLIALALLVVLTAGGGVAFLVYRARREVRPPHYRAEVVPAPGIRQQLADPAPAAIDPSAPREQHWHYHFHGVDEDRVAEILRRHQAPE